MQSGFLGVQIKAPSSIIDWLNVPASSCTYGSNSCSYALRVDCSFISLLSLFSLDHTLNTLPSTVGSGWSNAILITAACV